VRVRSDRKRDHPRLLLENQRKPPIPLRVAFLKSD
jgi:hypothetical protein